MLWHLSDLVRSCQILSGCLTLLCDRNVDWFRTPVASLSSPLTFTSLQLWSKLQLQCGIGTLLKQSWCRKAFLPWIKSPSKQQPGGMQQLLLSLKVAGPSTVSAALKSLLWPSLDSLARWEVDFPLCSGWWSCRSKLWPKTQKASKQKLRLSCDRSTAGQICFCFYWSHTVKTLRRLCSGVSRLPRASGGWSATTSGGGE